ncbi:MAG TPA: 50S ribosomal protein L4 [Candidatus Paceibacterota bacterium]|nr:50S ribosomal protein L4 [Candidatus Paceibacterota bacterium]
MATPHKDMKSSGPSTAKKTMKKEKAEKSAAPIEAKVYSLAGKEVATMTLPEAIFGKPWKSDLVHQVVTAMQANKRQNRAHTKDRAEVSGGGKKPWKQKGTGQARHGSSRSPIWRHGGVTFGPRTARDYSEKINKKMRVGALLAILSRKAKDGEIVLVESLSFAAPKTKDALTALSAISKAANAKLAVKGKSSALIALDSYDANVVKSFRNVDGVSTEEVRAMSPVEVLSHKYLVIENPEAAFKALIARAK